MVKYWMAPQCLLRILVLCYFLLLLLAEDKRESHEDCPPSFLCGNLGLIHFPFTNTTRPGCGLPITGCDQHGPGLIVEVQEGKQRRYEIQSIAQDNSITVLDHELHSLLKSCRCNVSNYTATLPPSSPIMSFEIVNNITLFRCNHTLNVRAPRNFTSYTDCDGYDIYYSAPHPPEEDVKIPASLSACSVTQLPIGPLPSVKSNYLFDLSDKFTIRVILSEDCDNCYNRRGGQCRLDKGKFYCANSKGMQPEKSESTFAAEPGKKRIWKWVILIVASVITVCALGMTIMVLLYKRRRTSSNFQNRSRNSFADPFSNPDPETSSVFFGVPVFSCKELEEATSNFNPTRELGSGGFGTVYYGKLQDGREVAVKRLYEHQNRRVEQFMNEIEILTRLRHRNLVSFYGCTSRHSRELLLVYEYIPNGTVACHLHGDLARPGLLPWPTRMKIAIETASALTYLHASDIIHRDVKTNNILLDNSFCVKVADFGLSRLFPNDVTHVSTVPQGTPGYVDPEYHQCYQLTSKSDVYSFGVVLIELISSMLAVDITRLREEINLANLAIKKIQESAFSELVDPSLGTESDIEVKRMVISVAELAYQCLQRDKALRPTMDEVLEVLKKIESGRDEPERQEDVCVAGMSNCDVHPPTPPSPDCDEVGLLKNIRLPLSPNTVIDKWDSESPTLNVSS